MKRAFLIAIVSISAQAAKVTALRTPDNGIQPQAAVDAKGVVHLVYFKGDPDAGNIFYIRREPGQADFSKPIQVNTAPHTATAIGTIRGAQLAVGKNGRVHVVWNGMGEGDSRQQPNTPAPLLYARLNDAAAFEPERNIITYARGLDGGSSVAADAEGNVYVIWHAQQPGNTNGEAGRAVFVARSTDEGKTFQRELPAISKPTGACGCCGMRAFADSKGDLLALYRAAYQNLAAFARQRSQFRARLHPPLERRRLPSRNAQAKFLPPPKLTVASFSFGSIPKPGRFRPPFRLKQKPSIQS